MKKRLISHRGNVDGKYPQYENLPEYVDKALDLGYDGLIMFTDGYAPFPSISPNKEKKILWALHQCDEGVNIPYGKKVIIPDLLK